MRLMTLHLAGVGALRNHRCEPNVLEDIDKPLLSPCLGNRDAWRVLFRTFAYRSNWTLCIVDTDITLGEEPKGGTERKSEGLCFHQPTR